MEAQVALWIGAFSYPAVFLLLVLCGLGVPLSEELIILTGGLVVERSGAHLQGMMLAAYLGVLAGDSALFFVGRSLGQRVFTHPRLARMLTPPRVAFLRQLFERRGAHAVFLARFLPGVRAPAFLLAGASGLPYRRFLLADGAAAWVGALGLTWLGYRFGPGILTRVQGGLRWLLLAAGLAAVGMLLVRWFRRRTVRVLPRRAES